jgi:glycosidase
LGTEQDLKELIAEFHKNGIKVFFDVITHGVMGNSSLITQHPCWFRGGSWGMVDYDWFGNHNDLDKWWIDLHTNYVNSFGVDGYRLDVDIYRPDLWKQIKENCANSNHPIVVWLESDLYSEGACDFLQRQTRLSIQEKGLDKKHFLLNNAARHFTERYNINQYFQVTAHYSDSTDQYGYNSYDPARGFFESYPKPFDLIGKEAKMLKVSLLNHTNLAPSNQKLPIDENAYQIKLKIENLIPEKQIKDISIRGRGNWNVNWQLGSANEWSVKLSGVDNLILYLKPFVADIKYYSVQLSSHDDGWDGFPINDNPYVAEGSRFLFGYSCLFTPAIPIFFGGEEFNAQYKPLPNLAPDLFGKINDKEGNGKWLYGSWMQWNQLKQKDQADMLDDIKKMIRIRKENSDLFFAGTDNVMPNIMALEYESDSIIPVPYVVWNEKKIVIIAGNNTDSTVACVVKIPLDKFSLNGNKTYVVHDLWNEKTLQIKGIQLANYAIKIKRDKVKNGGISIIEIER